MEVDSSRDFPLDAPSLQQDEPAFLDIGELQKGAPVCQEHRALNRTRAF